MAAPRPVKAQCILYTCACVCVCVCVCARARACVRACCSLEKLRRLQIKGDCSYVHKILLELTGLNFIFQNYEVVSCLVEDFSNIALTFCDSCFTELLNGQ